MWQSPRLHTIRFTVNPEPTPTPPPVPAPPGPEAFGPAATGSSRPNPATAPVPPASAAPLPLGATGSEPRRQLPLVIGAIALALLAGGALALSWASHQRTRQLEQALVARQQQSQAEVAESLMMARQSQDAAREVTAKMALLEARVAEAAVQRSQLDELIQSLTRSRDENLLADLEAALRVAQQQSALTGSPEPLISTLRQADERLARYNQPRLERVRRAVLRDLERVRSAAVVDVPSLVIRIDEVVRQIDDLPLAGSPMVSSSPSSSGTSGISASSVAAGAYASSGASGRSGPGDRSESPTAASTAASAAASGPSKGGAASGSANAAPASSESPWWHAGRHALSWLSDAAAAVWRETRELVRLSRIDNPEAVLAAPEQVFFLRENLKLRLLNARLALLSRQFDIAQSDLRDSQRALQRYFDPASRRVTLAQDQIGQITQQARQVTLPRPEDTLAALASVNAGR